MPENSSIPPILNPAAEKLRRGEVVISMSAKLVVDHAIGVLAGSAGFDIVFIDMEHGAFSMDDIGRISVAAHLSGVTPLVRVPSLDVASRVLDMGALGVIAPHIDDAAAARRLVEATKFPPLGDRSAAGRFPQARYQRIPTIQSYAQMNSATLAVAMIESAAGLRNVDAIAAEDGIDMLHIGATDLSNALGHIGEPDHPDVEAACRDVIAAGLAHGKPVGIGGIGSRPEMMTRLVAAGARYLSMETDIDLLYGAAAACARDAREIASRGVARKN